MDKRVSERQEVTLQRQIEGRYMSTHSWTVMSPAQTPGEEEEDDSLASMLNRQRDPRTSCSNGPAVTVKVKHHQHAANSSQTLQSRKVVSGG